MADFARSIRIVAAVSILGLAACGHSGGPSSVLPASSGTTAQEILESPPGPKLSVAPASLNFYTLEPKTVTVTVPFAGAIAATSSNPAAATVSPGTEDAVKTPGTKGRTATFTVTPVAFGVTYVTLTDKKGDKAIVAVCVFVSIAYYRFEDCAPACGPITSVLDDSPNRRNGSVLSGTPTYDASVPVSKIPYTHFPDISSGRFAGSDSAAFSYAFPFQTYANATLEFWIRPSRTGEGDIFWTTLQFGDANRFNIGIDTANKPFIDYRAPNGVLHQLGTAQHTAPAGEWTFVAYVKSGDVYRIYMNNAATANQTVLESSATDVSPNLPTSTGWTINGRLSIDTASCCQYDGLIDEVWMLDQALPPSLFLVTSSAGSPM